MADAFGYGHDHRVSKQVVGGSVAEGKHTETLAPVVILYLRETADSEPVGHVMPVEMAEHLASELARMAARAREKHWE